MRQNAYMLRELTRYIERYARIPLNIYISLIWVFWPYLVVIIKESSEKVPDYKSDYRLGFEREGNTDSRREGQKGRSRQKVET
jgi:hypothetical protein